MHQIQSGTSTNEKGYFEIKLNPGVYEIVFQYMGYETVTKKVKVGTTMQSFNVVLKENSILLRSATVLGGKEDPAYTLMRKAIAKAPFHLNEIDWYSAEVYVKGSGRVIDAPFFIRKKLAEEGYDSTTAYISETVTEVEFTRPNVYKQHVISTRTSGSDNNQAQTGFIFGSFYEPEIGDVISPLSRKAFAYYKFKYVESFSDRGYTINKIHVIPRSKSDDVVEGYLYLVENDWNIYRINFVTYKEGIKVKIKADYAPVEEKIWLPLTIKFDIEGKFFGVKFEYKYLATIGKYKWKINPDLDFNVEIIDEKIDKELAQQIEALDKKVEQNELANWAQEDDPKVTRKQLKKLLKEYEKEQENELDEEEKDVETNYNYSIDSLANKKDSAYWDEVRSVPLDSLEVNGYHKLDSIMVDRQEKEAADSTKKATFGPLDLLFGYTFKFNDTSSLRVFVPLNYNTVDGFLLGAKLRYRYYFSDSTQFQVSGETHYGFSRTALLWQGETKYKYGSVFKRGSIALSGGKMDVQINEDNPIDPILNTLTTLFMQDNFMKLYQNEFVKLRWKQAINHKWNFDLLAQYSVRTHLVNTTDFTFIKYHNRGYTPNQPENQQYDEVQRTINNSTRLIYSAKLAFLPWQKTKVFNGEKSLLKNTSPVFWSRFTQGFDPNETGTGYNDVSIGYKHFIKVKGAKRLRLNSFAGLRTITGNSSKTDFIDYAHFMGNQSPLLSLNPVNQYRMLPYYANSTEGAYASVLVNYEFRKLALTQLFFVRMMGVKENLFANYLYTDYNTFNYFELGYGLENIFRVFKIEVVTNNYHGAFNDWAIRFGITAKFSDD